MISDSGNMLVSSLMGAVPQDPKSPNSYPAINITFYSTTNIRLQRLDTTEVTIMNPAWRQDMVQPEQVVAGQAAATLGEQKTIIKFRIWPISFLWRRNLKRSRVKSNHFLLEIPLGVPG